MKRLLALILIFILAAHCQSPDKKPDYGSSHGKRIKINGKHIYFEEYGNGTPLILLSGGGLTRSISDFEKCIPDLSKHYRVIAPDSPGQGRSEQADSLTYQVLLETMSAFIDSLHVDSVYVMGWSDGGITAILLAEQRPNKVKKAIAVGANNGLRRAIPPDVPLDSVSPPPVDKWGENHQEIVDNYMKKLPRDWKKQLRQLYAMWYEREAYFSDSIYGRINIPVMIVLGDRDDIVIDHGLGMHRLIKNSQFCVLPNTSHDVFTERPELINKIAMDFFSK